MASPAYLDFDLRFRKERDGYRVELVQSPAGHGERNFSLPFNDIELENYLLKIGQRRSGVRRADSPETQAAREFGARLFDSVFQDELSSRFRESLDEAKRQESGLRLRLDLSGTPELADLPWEYLYHTQPREFLALSAETPIVRYLDLPDLMKPLAVTPPLRALVMISSPVDFEKLDVDREWQKLREAVSGLEARGLLVVDRLEKATLPELQARLRKAEYHIFHFIGHGGFNPQTQEGVLVLEDENGRGRLVSGEAIGVYLKDESTLRLVILNACEGGRGSRHDPFAGTAQSLVLKNIPAVIAMQFEVTDEAAITMAHGFYSALADGYAVDAALAEARKAVFARGNAVEWGTPVLFLRAANGRIFNVDRSNTSFITGPKTGELLRSGDDAFAIEDWTRAKIKYEAVLKLDPRNEIAHRRLQEIKDTKELVEIYEHGVRCFEGRRWREALDAFESVSKKRHNFRDVAGRAAQARCRIEESLKPPAIPPGVSVKREVVTPSKIASPPRTRIEPVKERKRGSGWIWPVIGIGVVLVLAVVAFGIWYAINESRGHGSYFPQPGPVVPDYGRDNIDHPYVDSVDDSPISPSLIGMPAGTAFEPRGWWTMRISGGLNAVNRLQFAPNHRFSGTATSPAWGTVPVTGTWSYDSTTSMLRLDFNTGDWVSIQLMNAEGGFRSTLLQGFVRFDYYFTREGSQNVR